MTRQEQDCRELILDKLGGEIYKVYVDNDTSAYKQKRRKAWEEMLADVEAGRVTGVVAWHIDRLTRRPSELEGLIDMANQRGLALATVTGDVDVSTPMGRLLARQLGSIARYEVEHRSERIRRKTLEMARNGEAYGGNRPFGYNADKISVNQAEAEVIRDMAERVLRGDTLASVVRWLESERIRPVRAKSWSTTSVRAILKSGRIAGLRQHNGRIVAKAKWPAIIDEVTHKRLKALLTDPSRATNHGATARRYLLTGGVARCGRCGHRMRAYRSGKREPVYRCGLPGDLEACASISQKALPLEEYVADHVLARISDPDIQAAIANRNNEAHDQKGYDVLSESLAKVEGNLEELAVDYYTDKAISRNEYLAARGALEAKASDLREAMSRMSRVATVGVMDFTDLATWWAEASIDQRRALVATLLEKVVIYPGGAGKRRFQEDRVELVWR